MERESSKECSDSFLWTNESFPLWNRLLTNSTLFSSRWIRALGEFWTNRVSKVSEKTLEVHSVLYGHRKYVFKREFLYLKSFMDFLQIMASAWKKNHKMCICNWFFAMCSADLTYVNGSRMQLVLYANCFLGLTYGFLDKRFQEIKLFICHCSFITLAQITIVRLQIVFLVKLYAGYSPLLNIEINCTYVSLGRLLLFMCSWGSIRDHFQGLKENSKKI